jgi:hypothetical protein
VTRTSDTRRIGSHGRRDAGDAFLPDPGGGPALASDDLAEELAEEFLISATTGQEHGEEGHEQFVEEEIGGPFVVTTSGREFAHGDNGPEMQGAEREATPTPGPVESDDTEDDEDATSGLS